MKTLLAEHTEVTLRASSAYVVLDALLLDLLAELEKIEQDQMTLNPNDPRFGNNYIMLQTQRELTRKLASSISEALNRKEL